MDFEDAKNTMKIIEDIETKYKDQNEVDQIVILDEGTEYAVEKQDCKWLIEVMKKGILRIKKVTGVYSNPATLFNLIVEVNVLLSVN